MSALRHPALGTGFGVIAIRKFSSITRTHYSSLIIRFMAL